MTTAMTNKLVDWQRLYAVWLVGQEGRPALPVRRERASLLAGRAIEGPKLTALEGRAEFKLVCAELAADSVRLGREMVMASVPQVMREMEEMRKTAVQNGDYREFMKYAAPILERVWPKSGEVKRDSPTVVIQMGTGFAQKVTATVDNEVLVLETPEG